MTRVEPPDAFTNRRREAASCLAAATMLGRDMALTVGGGRLWVQ